MKKEFSINSCINISKNKTKHDFINTLSKNWTKNRITFKLLLSAKIFVLLKEEYNKQTNISAFGWFLNVMKMSS